MFKKGRLRGEKVLYKDGVGCCVWQPIDEDEDDWGLCWDFSGRDIHDLIHMLEEMRDAEPEVFKNE